MFDNIDQEHDNNQEVNRTNNSAKSTVGQQVHSDDKPAATLSNVNDNTKTAEAAEGNTTGDSLLPMRRTRTCHGHMYKQTNKGFCIPGRGTHRYGNGTDDEYRQPRTTGEKPPSTGIRI